MRKHGIRARARLESEAKRAAMVENTVRVISWAARAKRLARQGVRYVVGPDGERVWKMESVAPDGQFCRATLTPYRAVPVSYDELSDLEQGGDFEDSMTPTRDAQGRVLIAVRADGSEVWK